MLEDLKRLETSMRERAGPSPTFTFEHVIMALLLLGEEGSMGRKRLSESLSIGEGATRTMLSKLKVSSLFEVYRSGCRLTGKGYGVYRWIRERMDMWVELQGSLPWSYRHSFGIRLKGITRLSQRGIEERDAAIKAGAEAAMVLRFEAGELHMPGVSNLSLERPEFASMIIERFKPSDGDVILIVGANDRHAALYSTISAAYFMVKRNVS